MKVDSRFLDSQMATQVANQASGKTNFSDDTQGTGKPKRVCCGRGCCSAGAFRKVDFNNLAQHFGQAQNAQHGHHHQQNAKVV